LTLCCDFLRNYKELLKVVWPKSTTHEIRSLKRKKERSKERKKERRKEGSKERKKKESTKEKNLTKMLICLCYPANEVMFSSTIVSS